MQDDITWFVKCFQASRWIARGCVSSFITLIPKTKDLLTLKDYRHVSLICSLYKIITEALANRIKRVIDLVIDEIQTGFIEYHNILDCHRNILDGPLIINEILSWAKIDKKKAFLFKVDFDNVFYSVNCQYLDSVMSQMGFGNRWRFWIRGYLASSRASVLINGSPTKEFPISKRVRQGDPLSPFLFLLFMECLSTVMRSTAILPFSWFPNSK